MRSFDLTLDGRLPSAGTYSDCRYDELLFSDQPSRKAGIRLQAERLLQAQLPDPVQLHVEQRWWIPFNAS